MRAWSAPVAISDADLRFLGGRMGCDFTSGPRRAYLDRWDTCDVQAAPGSGKTTLLVAKLVHLARNWPFQQQGVCVLSHTNVARYEIEEGVAKIPEAARLLAYPNFIGTLTTFFHTFLALPLLRGLGWPMTRVDDDMFSARVCALLRTKPTLKNTPKVKERSLREWASKLTLTVDFDACENGPPAQLKVEEQPGLYGRHSNSRRELEELKAELCADGIFRFADMTAFARRALQLAPDLAQRIATRFPLVILDEAQDTSASHLQLVDQVFGGGRSALQRIGDCNQAILGVDDSGGFAWTPGADHIDLGESLRFGSGIARFASKITCRRRQTIDGKGSAYDWPPHLMLVSDGSEVSVGKRFAELVASKFTESVPSEVWAVGWIHKPSDSKTARRLGSYFTSYEPPQRSADHAKTLLGALQEEFARPGAACGRELAQVVDVYARHLRALLAVQVPRNELPSITQIWRWLEDARPGSAREARSILLRIVELRGSVSASEWRSLTKRLRDALDPALARTTESTTIDALLSYTEKERSDSAGADGTGDEATETHNIDGRTVRVQVGTIASVKGRTHDATLLVQTTKGSVGDVRSALEIVANGASDHLGPDVLRAVMNVFVGATRPRHLLCLAVPKDKRVEKLRPALEEQGVVIIEVP